MKIKNLLFATVFLAVFGCGSGNEDPYDKYANDGNGTSSEVNDGSSLPDSNVNSNDEENTDADTEEPVMDPEWAAADDDGDGIPNGTEGTKDTDVDGIPDYLDTDSDNDGIPDSIEAPHGVPVDDDGDGIPNYLDYESDGDGIPDAIEGTMDADGDGTPNYRDTDSDNDGILDSYECFDLPCVDSDGDGTPDYLDNDSDNDGLPDLYEGTEDFDHDGLPNFIDTDSDGDGISDAVENAGAFPPLDTDGDGAYDFLDMDSDGDGLSDSLEYEVVGSNPKLADSDGDGFDDNSEFILGSDPNDAASVISEDAFYVLLPYNGEPVVQHLKFSTDIQKVDVLIMVDLSGSMMDEHANLKNGIKNTIIDGVRNEIPDSAFGLVKFGTLQDDPYILAQPITMNADAVKSAVDGITDCNGSDEYHTHALWEAACGEGDYEDIKTSNMFGTCTATTQHSDFTVAPVNCSGQLGSIGGACFRDEALPIFIMASDEGFTDDDFCGWKDGSRKNRDMAIEKMNAINAKFIGLDSGSSTSDFNYISDGTGSNDGAGNRFNFKVNADGTGFSQAIVDAVVSLTNNIQIDITTKVKHVPNEFGLEDTTKFVKSISPEIFPNVKPGQEVNFDVTFENDFYQNESYESKVFTASISVLGDGAFLDMRDVIIVVPGKDYNGHNE